MSARTSRTTPASRDVSGAPSVSVGVRRDQSRVPFGGDRRYFGVDLTASTRPRPANSARTPVSIGIVIDRSGSMNGQKIDVAKRAAVEIVNRLHDGDEIALTEMEHHANLVPWQIVCEKRALRSSRSRRIDAAPLCWILSAVWNWST